jgi:YD repeat-containing protein
VTARTAIYDAENKLVTATTVTPRVHAVIYQYDPLGRRFAKSVDATVTQYLSDQSEEIGEYPWRRLGRCGQPCHLYRDKNGQ